jgi:hypothetical protein
MTLHHKTNMRPNLRFFAALLIAGSLASAAYAGPSELPDYSKDKNPVVQQQRECDPRWYISIGGGTDFDYGATDFSNSVNALVPAFGIGLNIKSHEYSGAYDTNFYRFQGEVGYVLLRNFEVFAMFKYSHADSQLTRGSTVTVLGGGPTFGLVDTWGDYTSYGGELGFRYFFLPQSVRFRPYVSIAGGATHVDSIDLSVHVVGDGTAFKGAFYNSSVVGTGSAMLGVEIPLACHFSVGVEGGVRYESSLSGNDRDLINQGYSAVTKINNAGDRLYCPLTAYVKFRF